MTFRTFREDGRIDGIRAPERRITVATDASVYEGPGVALAYASSHGHYGLHAHPYPKYMSGSGRSTVCELRAVLIALEAVFRVQEQVPVRVLTDSEDALHFLRRWRQGDDCMPAGYSTFLRSSGTQSSLVTLSRKVQRHQMISFRLVTGHTGHPLNETADSLAKLGLRHGRGQAETKDVKRLVPMWAERGHADYLNALRTSGRGKG